MSFGTIIKDLRREKRLSQSELGKAIGVSCSSISQYETDQRFPEQNILKALSLFFDVSTDYLLGISSFKHSPLNPGKMVIDCRGFSEEQMKTVNFLVRSFITINKEKE